jgi:hypothetical protein
MELPAVASPPDLTFISTALLQLRDLVAIFAVLCYVFAAGKIADFLQSRGSLISRREALLAPLAYMVAGAAGVLIYFSSDASLPPQNTPVTLLVYMAIIPIGIIAAAGATALYAIFRGRIGAIEALDLSMRVILAPLFDGLAGYWAALGAAALLVAISAASYYSSGGNLSLVTTDFLLLSSLAALYFLYRMLTAQNNEAKAGALVTCMIIIAPGILRLYFTELVCAGLSLIPLEFFQNCPLLNASDEVTLALSVLATLIVIVPIIPFVYAIVVNALRFLTLIGVMVKKEKKEKKRNWKED